ncbi:MAG TPA: hypothetical protein VEC15_04975 [Actinomycetota bacterium]|jgi:hypothetical protein|nr:hypothetical protein [Actinomycetota bacterium]
MPGDRRGRLTTDPFTHHVSKDGTVRVSRGGRVVATIGGPRGERLIRAIEAATSAEDVQQLLARATGNYRRGNERTTG